MRGPIRKPTRRFISLLLIALFLVLATIVGLASSGVSLGAAVLSGVQRAARGASRIVVTATDSVTACWRALFYARTIYAENEKLRIENQYLAARLYLLQDDRRELSRLQQELVLQQELSIQTLLAQVVGRATGLRSMDVFIDRGTALGVVDGAGVFAMNTNGELYVYGKIRGATASSATVIPILDSRCVISGINRRTGEDVLVKGTDGEYCELSFISPTPEFQSGDIIVTSASSPTFPPNIPIGHVTSVTQSGTTHLALEPFAQIWATRYLLVAVKPK